MRRLASECLGHDGFLVLVDAEVALFAPRYCQSGVTLRFQFVDFIDA